MTAMSRAAIAISLFCVFAPVAEPQVYETHVKPLPNGCLVMAYEFQADQSLRQFTWSRLIRVQYLFASHAYCVFSLRNGELFSYDALHGSMKLYTHDRSDAGVEKALKEIDPNIFGHIEFLD